MLSDLLWTLILCLFIFPGLRHLYIALCGYIFVEILRPQQFSFSFLAGKPISLIIALIFFFSIAINHKQLSSPKNKTSTFLLVLLMTWITVTSYYAEFPSLAWYKYDFAIKTIFISLFIPYILNTKVKIDTFIAILVCCISYFTMMVGNCICC